MDERLVSILDECLRALETGESVESCLARYPEEAADLAPLLQIARALEDLPQTGPTTATRQTAKAQFLTEVERRWASVVPNNGQRFEPAAFLAAVRKRFARPAWRIPARALATAALSLALVLLLGGGAIYASEDSLPGDPLYAVKMLQEDLRRVLTFGEHSRLHLEEALTEKRRVEVERLLAKGRREEVNFGGLLWEWGEGTWLVDGIPVIVDQTTRLQAQPTTSVFIEIHGVTQVDGTVRAELVEIEGDEIIGRVEVISPSRWQVAGHPIYVGAKRHIQDGIQTGDCVEVHARQFPGGRLLALEIELIEGCEDNGGEGQTNSIQQISPSTPSPTATATSEPTLTPTAIATPTAGQEPLPALEPTATLRPPSPTPTIETAQDDDQLDDDSDAGDDDHGNDAGDDDSNDQGGDDDHGNDEGDDDPDADSDGEDGDDQENDDDGDDSGGDDDGDGEGNDEGDGGEEDHEGDD